MGCFFAVVLIQDEFMIRSPLCREAGLNWLAEKWRLSEYGSDVVGNCVVVGSL